MQTESNIQAAISKLNAAQRCHPNAVQILIEEAIEFLQSASPRITEQDAAVKAWGDAIAKLSKGREDVHPDDIAVDRFAEAMKIKLAKCRDKGRGGWQNPTLCKVSDLAKMLIDHLPKGDPVDVANFAMMLFFRDGGSLALKDIAASYAITEQDAREIVTDWLSYSCDENFIPDFEWNAPDWKKRLRYLLNKLNDKPESVGG